MLKTRPNNSKVKSTTLVLVPESDYRNIPEILHELQELKVLVAELKEGEKKEWLPIKEFCKQIQISYSQYHLKRNREFASLQIKKRGNRLFVHSSEIEVYWENKK